MTRIITPIKDEGPVQISRYWSTFRRFTFEGLDVKDWPAVIDLEAEWNDEHRTFEVRKFSARAKEGGEPITGSTLRAIPVSQALTLATWRYFGKNAWSSEGPFLEVMDKLEADGEALGRNGPTPVALKWVGLIYEMGSMFNEAPTKLVGHHLHIPPRTATHWVKLARERGHLD